MFSIALKAANRAGTLRNCVLLLFLFLIGAQSQAQVLRVVKGVFTDTTNSNIPVVIGATVKDDALVFGSETGGQIKLYDKGLLSFSGGFTIKAELYFEQTPNYPLAMKVSSLSADFKNGKFNSSWMSFPSEPIFTTKTSQYNYYPVGTELLNGYATLPLNEWVKVEINYDESLGITTTKINGVEDRRLVRYRGKEKVWSVLNQPMYFLQNATNVRVREISFKSGQPEAAPTMTVYANGLPYTSQVQLTFDQIDKRLKLPIAVTVYQQRKGQLTRSFTMRLNNLNRKDTLIPMLAFSKEPMNVKVKTSFLEQDFEITNKPAPSPYTGKFPLVLFHAQPEDFDKVAFLGFNTVLNDFNIMSSGLPTAEIKQALDSGEAKGLKVMIVANSGSIKLDYVNTFKNHPALCGWFIANEPFGPAMMDTVRDDNNAVKLMDEKHPTMALLNNFNRLTGIDCDIIGVDPYPIPNISMRMVDDAVKAALKASNGTKPVWSVIPHYLYKMPTFEELKSMAWLGIVAGAHGVGLFEYDHRSPATPTGYYMADYADQMEKVGTVFREIATWDWLLTAKAVVYPTNNLAVHACTKTANGKTYLLVANDSRKAELSTFTVGTKLVTLTLNPLEVRQIDMATLP